MSILITSKCDAFGPCPIHITPIIRAYVMPEEERACPQDSIIVIDPGIESSITIYKIKINLYYQAFITHARLLLYMYIALTVLSKLSQAKLSTNLYKQ